MRLCAALALIGCSKQLSRDEALRLANSEREPHEVWIEFVSEYPPDRVSDPAVRSALEALTADRVLICPGPRHDRFTCSPGSRPDGLIGAYHLKALAGTVIAGSVTGISQTGENTAMAELTGTFRPSSLYSKHRDALQTLNRATMAEFMNVDESVFKQDRLRADFRRYDDGWRLEDMKRADR